METTDYTYHKSGLNIIIRYTLEYIDSKADFDTLQSDKHPAPWDLYKKRMFQNLNEALDHYIVAVVSEWYYDFKLYEEVLLDGEVVRENYIIPGKSIHHAIASHTNRNLLDLLESATKKSDALQQQNQIMTAFIEKHGASRMFEEYQKNYFQSQLANLKTNR